MENPVDLMVRERLASYLADETSLSEFADWFVPNVLGPVEELTSDRATIDRVYRIELFLVESENGDWPEEELREQLAKLLQTTELALSGS